MSYIILGIIDYCKDCWHDYIVCKWARIRHSNINKNYYWQWKEGNLKHYIKQRKWSK